MPLMRCFHASARKKAAEVQEKLDQGTAGKLAGMVIGIKDNICYKDHRVSASSKMLDGFVSPYSSTVVQRLLDEDAIIIGRLNCDEFAMGGSNETSFYGPVKNALMKNGCLVVHPAVLLLQCRQIYALLLWERIPVALFASLLPFVVVLV